MRSLMIAALCISAFYVKAQIIRVGEGIPNIRLGHVINHDSAYIRLSDYKGKLLILDFWNTACLSCIQAFPKIDSLQKKFNLQLQFILVSKESRDSVERFFQKRPRIRRPSVPMITGDKTLSKFFPHKGFPYQVWIDETGMVKYFTSASNATSSNIAAYLNNKQPIIQNFSAESTVHDSRPFTSNEAFNKLEYYSFIAKCASDLRIGTYEGARSEDGDFVKISAYCASIVELCKKAYGEAGKYNFRPKESVQLIVSDTFRFSRPRDIDVVDAWKRNHAYSYYLMLPANRLKNLYKDMQQDIATYFDLEISVEKKTVQSYVLINTGGINKLKTNGGSPMDKLLTGSLKTPNNDSIRYIRNMPFYTLTHKLKAWIETIYTVPFFDETGFAGNIDIFISGKAIDPLSIEQLTLELNAFNLDIVQKNREVDVLVIKEKALATGE